MTFLRRFFSQQFKRSCIPDGPKVGTVSLSPRGDWRMPSDASSALWLKEAEALELGPPLKILSFRCMEREDKPLLFPL